MVTYTVKYLNNYAVNLSAHNIEHAKERSLALFQLKYPEITQMETDNLVVEEVPE